MRDIEKELSTLRTASAMESASSLISTAKVVAGTTVVLGSLVDGIAADNLRLIALDLRARNSNTVVALTSLVDEKIVLVVAVSDDARQNGVKAGALVKLGSAILGGGGGGKDDFAQGGGSDRSKIPAALEAIELAIAGK